MDFNYSYKVYLHFIQILTHCLINIQISKKIQLRCKVSLGLCMGLNLIV